MSGWAEATAPDLAAFESLAEAAFDALPPPIRAACAGIALRVDDFAPPEVLDEMGIDDPFALTGLYQGVALTEKSLADVAPTPDEVWLFRRPILEEWIDRGDVALGRLVAHVLVHELAHHFGWSDERIAQIDRWWE